jgi:hypothetical protein
MLKILLILLLVMQLLLLVSHHLGSNINHSSFSIRFFLLYSHTFFHFVFSASQSLYASAADAEKLLAGGAVAPAAAPNVPPALTLSYQTPVSRLSIF